MITFIRQHALLSLGIRDDNVGGFTTIHTFYLVNWVKAPLRANNMFEKVFWEHYYFSCYVIN